MTISVSHLLADPWFSIQSFPVTVLLVDDQPIIAETVKYMLSEESDITFHYCSDSDKALQTAIDIKPTVILQDLVMPKHEGLELVRFYRANPATAEIPIVVLSTKEEPLIKADAFATGANDYIVKLPDKIELIARVRYHSSSYIRLLERNEAFRRLEESQRVLLAELGEAAAYVRSLLPAPLDGAIKTSWRFIPSTQLGGDIFGYHWLDEDHFAIYLLDVCGHGVGAALLSVSVVNLLRSQTLPHADFHDPQSVLTELNEAFQMEKHNNMFFTIWYGVFNKQTREILYSSGGHPPAVLLTGESAETAQHKELTTPGVVIGALPEGNFQNGSSLVGRYNRLYVFSDGVYELAKVTGGMLDLHDFIRLVVATSDKKERQLDHLVHLMQDLQGRAVFVDDFSLLQVIFND